MKNKKAVKKTLKQILDARNRQIARDNSKFKKMNASQKRVQIARDVLAQLATKRLIAANGTWLTGIVNSLFTEKDVRKNKDLSEILTDTKSCTGCALGGLFMCAVERADKLKLTELEGVEVVDYDGDGRDQVYTDGDVDQGDITGYLEKFFDSEQLAMIEYTFEAGDGGLQPYDDHNKEQCVKFSELSGDPKERMRLIMENIVVNKGIFDPWSMPIATYHTEGFTG